MDSSSQDRNLPASSRKLQKARDEGQIARSRDLTHLAVLGGGTAVLAFWAPDMLDRLRAMLTQFLRFDAASLAQPAAMGERLAGLVSAGLMAYLPLCLSVTVAVVLSALASGGWVLTTKPLMPDLGRISPLEGFKRLFSVQQLSETAKLVALTVVMSALAWYFLASHLQGLMGLLLQPLPAALSDLGTTLFAGALWLTGVVLVVAGFDLPLQFWLHRSKLRMSHQETKQEHKETEGNPQIKNKQRARRRELAQRASVTAVPSADLVVMNPTHYAVALRYDEASMRAPRVVAKGADLVALRIRDLAAASAVPVLQAPMLARALYAHADIDQEVPAALYTAVAQVLAYVYQLKAALRGEAAAPPAFMAPEVPIELDPHARPALGSPA